MEENIGGGYGIVSTDNGGGSTVGFSATRNGVEGIVIAGHAGNLLNEGFRYNGITIGQVTHTAYRNNSTADAAFVATYTNTTPTNILANNSRIISASTNMLPVNTTVYMYGNVSGLQMGEITAVNYNTGTTISMRNQAKASYFSQGGDSGAPIFFYEGNYGGQTMVTLIGIHCGSTYTNDVRSGAYFSPYANIVNELGVSCIDE